MLHLCSISDSFLCSGVGMQSWTLQRPLQKTLFNTYLISFLLNLLRVSSCSSWLKYLFFTQSIIKSTISNFSTSTNPLSVNLRLGITGKHKKDNVIKASGNIQPNPSIVL